MEKEQNTVWRLTIEDFLWVMEDNHPELTEEQRNMIIETAKRRFNIDDWYEWVDTFIELNKDDFDKK